tara:strand:+ start:145 stop:411 length:267 start_codon:yes stop_codon:yes gene_type:complete
MASSKNPLTEEQIREGIFGAIIQKIMKGRADQVEKALKNNPRLKKATKNADKALKDLKKELQRQGGPLSKDIKKASPATVLKVLKGEL